MHQISHTVDIDAPADVTWGVVGDAGAIATWLPSLVESRLEGTTRYGTMPDGNEAIEEIVRHSDAERTYSYVISDAPLALDGYESTLKVEALGSASRVVWSAHFEADDALKAAVDDMYVGGLQNLKRHIETPS